MPSIEELKRRFPIQNVEPYGPCIVVPGDQFNPDWEAELNIDRIDTDFGDPGKPFTLIPLERKAELLGNLRATEWSETDAEKLLKYMSEQPGTIEAKCAELTKTFPGRSKEAIHQKYVKLKRAQEKAIERKASKMEGDKAEHREEAGKSKRGRRSDQWDPKDEERLLKRWQEVKGTSMQRAEQLLEEFPGRAAQAIYQKHWSVITSYKRKKTQKKEEQKQLTKIQKEPSLTAPSKQDLVAVTADVKKFMDTIIAIRADLFTVTERLTCAEMMHALEVQEKRNPENFKIPSALYKDYLNAMLYPNAWVIFKEKVRKLLEIF